MHAITRGGAHRVAGDLAIRIALAGPDDELKELADTFDAMLGRLDAAFATSAASWRTPRMSCGPR